MLKQVRNKVEETVTRLYNEIPGIRIAVFAHGDYQDKGSTYDTTCVDFSTDKKKICDFIKNVSSTCGYDSDECYELVLRTGNNLLFSHLSGNGRFYILREGGGGGGLLRNLSTKVCTVAPEEQNDSTPKTFLEKMQLKVD